MVRTQHVGQKQQQVYCGQEGKVAAAIRVLYCKGRQSTSARHRDSVIDSRVPVILKYWVPRVIRRAEMTGSSRVPRVPGDENDWVLASPKGNDWVLASPKGTNQELKRLSYRESQKGTSGCNDWVLASPKGTPGVEMTECSSPKGTKSWNDCWVLASPKGLCQTRSEVSHIHVGVIAQGCVKKARTKWWNLISAQVSESSHRGCENSGKPPLRAWGCVLPRVAPGHTFWAATACCSASMYIFAEFISEAPLLYVWHRGGAGGARGIRNARGSRIQ